MMRHRLTDKNLETMTATCSVDGSVEIRNVGNGQQCLIARANAQADYTRRNPLKVRANRKLQSEHQMTNRTAGNTVGDCAVCGPDTPMVPWGRGYACANRAGVLRTRQETSPQARCRRCMSHWYDRFGLCSYCDDPHLGDVGWQLRLNAFRRSGLDDVRTWGELENDATIYDVLPEPDDIDNWQPVPGWNVIGSALPWYAAV